MKSTHASVFIFHPFLVGNVWRDCVFGIIDLKSKERRVKPPGGMVECGEYEIHAVQRETSEEVGGNIEIKSMTSIEESLRRKVDDHHWRLNYVATEDDIINRVPLGTSVLVNDKKHLMRGRWWRLDDFSIHLLSTYRPGYVAALEAMMKYPDFRGRNQEFLQRLLVSV